MTTKATTKGDRIKMEKRDEHDTSSESDSDTLLPGCKTCGVSFASVKAYESHMLGKRHEKKVAQGKFLSKHVLTDKKEKDLSDSDDDDDDTKELYCEVCDKYFSGHVPFKSHLKGTGHAKNLKKQKLKERMKDMPEMLDKQNTENVLDSDDDGILPMPFARCSTCQKEFSGVESLALHMKSTTHKKKVDQTKKLETLKVKYKDEINLSDGEDSLKCDVCQKPFSGPIPYHIHMKSSVHKKNLEKMKVAEEMKEYFSKDDPEPGYVCKECNKSFTDPVAFKHHLTNNSHEKQRAKSALLEFLNAFPEIVFATPFEEYNAKDKNESDDSDQDEYFLICKICNASFSGPESAKDHVKSKKHITLKKEKKMRKLLKQQKKQISDSEKLNGEKDSQKDKISISGVKNGNTSVSKDNDAADDFELL